jgi:hypothetical protein
MRLSIFIFFAFASFAHAQTDSLAVIRGTVTDATGEPLIGATLKVWQNGEFQKGAITDFDGNYQIQIVPGKYDLEVNYTGFQKLEAKGVSLAVGQSLMQNFELKNLPLVELCRPVWKVPIINFDPANTGNIITSDQIRNMY